MYKGRHHYAGSARIKEKIVYDRKCKNCKNRKDGLDTVCDKYKCIPQSVQRGGSCEKYNG